MSRENDDWLIELGKMIEAEENQLGEVNTEKVEQVEIVKKALENIVDGVGVCVRSKLHSPYKSSGCIYVTGRQLIINDYEAFAQVSKIASVVDISPRTDGMVEINFTFNGLTKRRW